MEPIYTVSTPKSFDDAVKAIEEQTSSHGFRVLHVHNVQGTLAEKELEIKPLKIIEVCNARYAYSVLQIDFTVSLLLPCRINVYRDEDRTIISTLLPTALSSLFNLPELEAFARDVEKVLIEIIDASK